MVTIAICTYNRPELLRKCLDSLGRQTVGRDKFKVLVVDNFGDKTSEQAATEHSASYVHEPAMGLSNARNRAWKEADTTWVFYLDDDAIAHPDMVEQFLAATADEQVQVLGGRYAHYFVKPPARWLLRYYSGSVRASQEAGVVVLKSTEYLSGGIMACWRSLLAEHPFRSDLGMVGLQPGFGEEDEWQDRLRLAGITVHYSEDIAMDHLVQAHKQTIRDRLNLARAHGEYWAFRQAQQGPGTQVQGQNQRQGLATEFLRIAFITAPYDVVRVFFKPGFYWQNGVVSTFGKVAFTKAKYGW
jgi:glycosyltransferase involved in cell wall biosynthesis